jgi:8-oxo-dGTP diphosphatase
VDAPGLEAWVERELRRTPGVRCIVRSRTVSPEAFESASRRARAGVLFGVACRMEDARGRVLLVQGAPSHAWSKEGWMVPGGGAEPGEGPLAAVLREMQEETGIRPLGLRLWKAYREEVRSPSGKSMRWWFLQFLGHAPAGSRPRAGDPEEIQAVRWFRRLPPALHFREDWLRPPRDRARPLTRRGGGSARGRD